MTADSGEAASSPPPPPPLKVGRIVSKVAQNQKGEGERAAIFLPLLLLSPLSPLSFLSLLKPISKDVLSNGMKRRGRRAEGKREDKTMPPMERDGKKQRMCTVQWRGAEMGACLLAARERISLSAESFPSKKGKGRGLRSEKKALVSGLFPFFSSTFLRICKTDSVGGNFPHSRAPSSSLSLNLFFLLPPTSLFLLIFFSSTVGVSRPYTGEIYSRADANLTHLSFLFLFLLYQPHLQPRKRYEKKKREVGGVRPCSKSSSSSGSFILLDCAPFFSPFLHLRVVSLVFFLYVDHVSEENLSSCQKEATGRDHLREQRGVTCAVKRGDPPRQQCMSPSLHTLSEHLPGVETAPKTCYSK